MEVVIYNLITFFANSKLFFTPRLLADRVQKLNQLGSGGDPGPSSLTGPINSALREDQQQQGLDGHFRCY